MNSIQRISVTLSGGKADRRAFTPVLSLYGARLTQCPLEKYYTDPAAYAAGQTAVYEAFSPDVLFGPFAFASIGEVFGGRLHYSTKQPPNLKEPGVGSFQQFMSTKLPDPGSQTHFVFLAESIRRIRARHQSNAFIAACLPPPIDLPAMVFGMEQWLEMLLFNPNEALLVMEQIIPWFIRITEILYEAGATFIAMPCAFASPAILPRHLVQAVTLPLLSNAFSKIKGPVVLHHGGAPLLSHLDLLKGLPSVIAYALDQRDSLSAARNIVGPDTVLFGGVLASLWPSMKPQQLQDAYGCILDDRRDDSRFIVGNAGPDIPMDTPVENILAVKSVIESWAN